MNIFSKQKGMTIIGQGGKIILFMLPALIAAIWVHLSFPQFAALPADSSLLKPVGYVLLVPGVALWLMAIIQLLSGFSSGILVTSGAYGVVRNPIYASVALFILPGFTLLSLTWVYLVPAVFLVAGVLIFIRREEAQLTQVFGQAYVDYLARVDRLIPFRKPSSPARLAGQPEQGWN